MNRKSCQSATSAQVHYPRNFEQAGWDIATRYVKSFHSPRVTIIVRANCTLALKTNAPTTSCSTSNMPIAVIEAKDNKHSLGDGMQQRLGYADMLQSPFLSAAMVTVSISQQNCQRRRHRAQVGSRVRGRMCWQWWANTWLNPTQSELVSRDYYSDGSK